MKNVALDISKKQIVLAIVSIIALVSFYRACNVVPPGYRGVYVLFGNTEGQPRKDGFHFINPLATIIKVDVRQQKFESEGLDSSSSDLQSIITSIAVNYTPKYDNVVDLYSKVSKDKEVWESVLIDPAIEEILKSITALYTAEDLIHKRAETKKKIEDLIKVRLYEQNIHVVSVSITDFAFNKKFSDSIESKQIAEQRAKQAIHELAKKSLDVQQKVVDAEADKLSRIAQAEGKAREIELLAIAEAGYHQKVNETATNKSLLLRFIERWDGVAPKVMNDKMDLILSDQLLEDK